MMKTIILVDDSATMIMSIKTTLEMNGHQVDTASDGVAALEKLSKGLKPDLIITDVNMPKMGGMELIKNIKALPGFKLIPILTPTTDSDKRTEAKKLGATGWLVKPVVSADLVAAIKQVLPGA